MSLTDALSAAVLSMALAGTAGAFDLTLPIDCELGQTCFIQNYVDRDQGPGHRDFTCGPLSYDGHKGTDFRLPTFADLDSDVAVLAAAPGRVTALRDGEADRLFSRDNSQNVAGRECGNGVLINHGAGWVTQYCHLKRGSITVTLGETVEAGTVLGAVGLSGQTEFPHLHFAVRYRDVVTDPFAPTAPTGPDDPESCATDNQSGTLWRDALPYQAGSLLSVGFSDHMPDFSAIQAGEARAETLSTQAPALVFWGYAYGGRRNDQITLAIFGPKGELVSHRSTLENDQAQFFRAAGRNAKHGPWPAGLYRGTLTWTRDGQLIDQSETAITLAPGD